VMALPSKQRLQKKQLLLDAMRGILPAALASELATRPKRTFTFPFTRWLGNELRSTISETFEPGRLALPGVLDPVAVQNLWQRYLRAPESVGWSRLWSVFVLARWCEVMQVGV
jgi:asparagine synthase (glutamine-hydrolysing)